MFSVSRSHVKRVKAYVMKQEAHHSNGRTWAEWEETDALVEAFPTGCAEMASLI